MINDPLEWSLGSVGSQSFDFYSLWACEARVAIVEMGPSENPPDESFDPFDPLGTGSRSESIQWWCRLRELLWMINRLALG